jgi:hypothetical protein
MRLANIAALAAIAAPLLQTAVAEESVTVQSLLAQQFAIVGAATSPAGGALLFLQKQQQLYLCFITETPQSVAVTTRYCKPVQ